MGKAEHVFNGPSIGLPKHVCLWMCGHRTNASTTGLRLADSPLRLPMKRKLRDLILGASWRMMVLMRSVGESRSIKWGPGNTHQIRPGCGE